MALSDLKLGTFRSYRLPVVLVLVVISLLLELIVHWYLDVEVVYSHFFYIPVVLAAIWYGIRGALVAVVLGAALLVGTYVSSGMIDFGSVIRALMFVLVAVVIGVISDLMRREQDKMINEVADAALQSGLQASGGSILDLKSRVLSIAVVKRLEERGDVQGLIGALRNRDPGVQYEAVEALGRLRNPSAVPALIGALTGDQYSGIRWKAAEALAKIGTPAVPSLLAVLDHPDEDIRWKAAVTLGEIGDTRAIPPLVELLGDNDRFVRSRAAYALGLIGTPAVEALKDAVSRGDTDFRRGAVTALGKVDDTSATEALVLALGDPSPELQQDAISALVARGPRAVPALASTLYDPDPRKRMGAAQALAGTGDPGARAALEKALISADPETKEVLVSALREIDARAFIPETGGKDRHAGR
jgi:HEAT repeat protein